jgi:hypothetical protein
MSPGDLSLDKRLDRIESKLDLLLVDVVTLKTKAAIWGAVSGSGIAIVVTFLGRLL